MCSKNSSNTDDVPMSGTCELLLRFAVELCSTLVIKDC